MNLLHQTFPLETIDDCFERKFKNNKYSALYSRLSNQLEFSLYHSNECKKLRENILKKCSRCFKEVLSKEDRIDHPPVKIRLQENNDIAPSYHNHNNGLRRPFVCSKEAEKESGSSSILRNSIRRLSVQPGLLRAHLSSCVISAQPASILCR